MKPVPPLAVVLWLALGCVVAQTPKAKNEFSTRTVEGTVTDEAKQPVNGAVVQLEDTKTLQIRSYITQQDGKYHFTGLSTNVDYQLRAQHDGIRTGTKRLDVFNSRHVATINFRLKNKKK